MSNSLKAIALLDETIAKLTATRDEMQKRHDETLAAIAQAEKQTVTYAVEQMREQFRQIATELRRAFGKLSR